MLRSILFLLLFCCSLFAQAQQDTPIKPLKKWRVADIGLRLGGHTDVYSRMDLNQMLGYARNQEELVEVDLSGYGGQFYNEVSGGLISFSTTLQPLSLETGNYRTSRALRLGGSIQAGREGMISFDRNPNQPGNRSLESIVYCVVENEVSLQGEYLFIGHLSPRFYAYAGIGAQVAGTFDNDFLIFFHSPSTTFNTPAQPAENTTMVNEYAARETIYGRAFMPYGIGFHLSKRLDLNLNGRLGTGFQSVVGGDTYFIKRTGSTTFGVHYRFL